MLPFSISTLGVHRLALFAFGFPLTSSHLVQVGAILDVACCAGIVLANLLHGATYGASTPGKESWADTFERLIEDCDEVLDIVLLTSGLHTGKF